MILYVPEATRPAHFTKPKITSILVEYSATVKLTEAL